MRRVLSAKTITTVLAVASVAVGALSAPTAGGASTQPLPPSQDTFYQYSGGTPLGDLAPGTVLKTRELPYHLVGVPLPLSVTQLLYRSIDAQGRASANVTSVVHAPGHSDPGKAVSYLSFYDSLNPADEPSYSISGGITPGGSIPDIEPGFFGTFLLAGYSVIVPDTEGETADFAAGPEYGTLTLDAVRAATHSSATGLTPATRVGLFGYSGGAIAAEWAAALAPTYAPDVNQHLVGVAEGGVLVEPGHNLHYIEGSLVWAGVAVMAAIGIARAYDVDFTPYLNAYGLSLFAKLKNASITTVLGAYPGLTWAQIAKPAYSRPEDVPAYVATVNRLDIGLAGSPTVPMFIGQGANGVLEGTPGNKPGIGRGDGVMIAGDVRSLARQYCGDGTTVEYLQYDALSHTSSMPLFAPAATTWLLQRFAGLPAPNNCATIAPGNSLAPVTGP